MRILFDMDEVLCELNETLLEKFNSETKSDLSIRDIHEWNIECVSEELKEFSDSAITVPGLYESLPVRKEFVDALRHLQDIEGHDVAIVTSPPRHAFGVSADGKLKWIQECMPWFRGDIVMTSSKHAVRGDVLIDDAPHNVESWETKNNKPAILVDRPWNRSFRSFFRATTAAELLQLIKEIDTNARK